MQTVSYAWQANQGGMSALVNVYRRECLKRGLEFIFRLKQDELSRVTGRYYSALSLRFPGNDIITLSIHRDM